jgi:peptide/nickel transport system ATP-binding protein
VEAVPTEEAPLLEVDDLRTSFHTSRGLLRAVDGVSFTLSKGETIGIVGESGSGKSVLVRSVMNLLPGTAEVEGRVRFEGQDVRTLSRADKRHFWGTQMAMIFQDPMASLNPVKKIGVLLSEPLRYHLNLSREAARRRALELLDMVRISEAPRRLQQYPHELSGGTRQRVTIAIALSCHPKLLIADEPTTALDVTVQKQILDLLESLQRDLGMAMILVTHDLGVVGGRADRINVMYAGQIVESADAALLFGSVRHCYTAALLKSIPRIEDRSHTRLEAIAGMPPDMVNPPDGCRFAPRCRHAQPICLETAPTAQTGVDVGHRFACHFPVGTAAGAEAAAANARIGHTVTGLDLRAEAEAVS